MQRTPEVLTIDCQVHAYERDHPERPWAGTLVGPSEVTGDDMVAAMDAVGVDGALLVSPHRMYRFDGSYALEVHARHPGRFGLIKPIDPEASDVGDEVARWAANPGVVGARMMLTHLDPDATADHPGLNQILAAGAANDIPINVMCWGNLDLITGLARRHPNTRVVIDHLGIPQPFQPPRPERPSEDEQDVPMGPRGRMFTPRR